jgi:two-component system, OmpR family, KDP operon response regulator KdpE
MNILVAEADADLATAYRRFLAHHGFEVITASRGLDCLTLLRHWFPAVVALDLDLLWGGAGGILEHLREEGSRRSLPAVILTGQVFQDQLSADLLASPVVKYLSKPFPLSDLLASVRACLPETRDNGRPKVFSER